MNIMNIAYNFNIGGVERLIIDVNNQLAKTGNGSYLCIINNNYSEELLHGLDKEVKFFFLHKDKYMRKVSYVFQLCKLIRANKIDVLHIHQGTLMKFYALIKFLNPKVKVYFTVHDTYSFSQLDHTNQKISKLICTKLIAISNAVKRDILSNGISSKKVAHIYNAIDISRFAPPILKEDHKGVIIGCVARFSPKKKGQDILIEALKILKESGMSFECYFAGAPDSEEDMLEFKQLNVLSESYGMKEKIKFLGNVMDIPGLLKEIDVFVLPSRFEGFGISVVEALASGVPCVVSDVEGLNEVINNKQLGEIFEAGNSEKLANSIRFVANNKKNYDTQKLIQSAKERFSIEMMVNQMLSVYNAD